MKNKYRYETININGLNYIKASSFVGEGKPDPLLHEYPQAFSENLMDENGKLQWVIDRENPLNIYEAPQQLTSEEEKTKKNNEKRQEIIGLYSRDDEIKLMNSAIIALSEGKPLPQEYIDYRKTVDDILAKNISIEAAGEQRKNS